MFFLFFVALTVISAKNIEIFDPDFLKNFNPLRIYRDPFKFDDIPTQEGMNRIQNSDNILPKILDNTFEYNEKPRSSLSYSPIWFKL